MSICRRRPSMAKIAGKFLHPAGIRPNGHCDLCQSHDCRWILDTNVLDWRVVRSLGRDVQALSVLSGTSARDVRFTVDYRPSGHRARLTRRDPAIERIRSLQGSLLALVT